VFFRPNCLATWVEIPVSVGRAFPLASGKRHATTMCTAGRRMGSGRPAVAARARAVDVATRQGCRRSPGYSACQRPPSRIRARGVEPPPSARTGASARFLCRSWGQIPMNDPAHPIGQAIAAVPNCTGLKWGCSSNGLLLGKMTDRSTAPHLYRPADRTSEHLSPSIRILRTQGRAAAPNLGHSPLDGLHVNDSGQKTRVARPVEYGSQIHRNSPRNSTTNAVAREHRVRPPWVLLACHAARRRSHTTCAGSTSCIVLAANTPSLAAAMLQEARLDVALDAID